MCSGALILFGIERVVMGENETFVGAENMLKEYGVEVINLSKYFDIFGFQTRWNADFFLLFPPLQTCLNARISCAASSLRNRTFGWKILEKMIRVSPSLPRHRQTPCAS
jgi:hypothetical protein